VPAGRKEDLTGGVGRFSRYLEANEDTDECEEEETDESLGGLIKGHNVLCAIVKLVEARGILADKASDWLGAQYVVTNITLALDKVGQDNEQLVDLPQDLRHQLNLSLSANDMNPLTAPPSPAAADAQAQTPAS